MRALLGVKCWSRILSGGLLAGLRKAVQKACARPLIVKYLFLSIVDVGCGWLKLGAVERVVVFDLSLVCCFDDLVGSLTDCTLLGIDFCSMITEVCAVIMAMVV